MQNASCHKGGREVTWGLERKKRLRNYKETNPGPKNVLKLFCTHP